MDLDVDTDFDGKLLDQFRSMGTTDRDVLIAEFQAVLGNTPNPEMCAFFLDMNNWNLQNAVCSYYDIEQPVNSLPSVKIIGEVTIGNGEPVAPNSTFFKSWRIQNSGKDRWPPGCHLRCLSGNSLAAVERKMVDALGPDQIEDVHLEMRSPLNCGSYPSLWRMCTPGGSFFGDVINIQVTVAEGGLLGITQQMSRIGGQFCPNPVSDMGDQLSGQALGGITSVQQQQLVPFNAPFQQQGVCTSSPSACLPSGEEDAEMS